MEAPVTILYTGGIGGMLARLPAYATVMGRLRREAAGRVLLLDVGDGCVPESEPCALTEGRAVPIVLDATGYDAINVSGYLPDASRAALRSNYLNAALVDAAHPFVSDDGLAFAAEPPAALPHWLHIALATGAAPVLSPEPTLNIIHTLTLQTVRLGQVGEVVLSLAEEGVRLEAARVHEIPLKTPADPTIAGTVDFVMDEVRMLRRKQGH